MRKQKTDSNGKPPLDNPIPEVIGARELMSIFAENQRTAQRLAKEVRDLQEGLMAVGEIQKRCLTALQQLVVAHDPETKDGLVRQLQYIHSKFSDAAGKMTIDDRVLKVRDDLQQFLAGLHKQVGDCTVATKDMKKELGFVVKANEGESKRALEWRKQCDQRLTKIDEAILQVSVRMDRRWWTTLYAWAKEKFVHAG